MIVSQWKCRGRGIDADGECSALVSVAKHWRGFSRGLV